MSQQDTANWGATPEGVAYRLMQQILEIEGRPLSGGDGGRTANRNVILNLYAECIEAVQGNRDWNGTGGSASGAARGKTAKGRK